MPTCRTATWLRPGGSFILGVPNLAKHMALRRVRVLGRNWLRAQRPPAGTAADHLLRLHPPLCSDLYLIGDK
jgi:hypothetical protein